MKLEKVADFIGKKVDEILSYMDSRCKHWMVLCMSDELKHIMKEIRRRTRAVESFSSEYSEL